MAGTTGLEPATSCVTGMRSNQLNYAPERRYVLAWNPANRGHNLAYWGRGLQAAKTPNGNNPEAVDCISVEEPAP